MQEPRPAIAIVIGKMAFSGLVVTVLACIAGLAGTFAGYPVESRTLLLAAIVVLLILPVLGLVAEGLSEMRRGGWLFAALTAAVIAVLAIEAVLTLGMLTS
jgi:hypothetical protein